MSEPENDELEVQPNPVMHLIAPITAIGATLLMRKALNSAYAHRTGREAPDPRDPAVSFVRALGWAIVTAATAAAVETAVYRLMNRGVSSN
ncbi:MAG: DUF4235 domain-containing protein [Actinomycetota bacterium]|nr:DUF4235 domain-containing protein [Actinomycetota bacterium]